MVNISHNNKVTIERISASENSLFWKYYFRHNIPVIITELNHHFQVDFLQWKHEWLIQQFGQYEVEVSISDNSRYGYIEDEGFNRSKNVQLKTFVNALVDSDPHYQNTYLTRAGLDTFAPVNIQATLPAPYHDQIEKKIIAKNLWIGGKGNITSTHFDPVENFNIQIEGSKQFILHSPNIDNFYPHSNWSSAPHFARVNVFDPDDETFPRFQKASLPIMGILNAGEMLYIPINWWHTVSSLESINVNLNFWWINNFKMLKYPRHTVRALSIVLQRTLAGEKVA